MIHYALRCDDGHEFDGWFRDSAAFDRQVATGLVECTTCGGTGVRKQLMTPAVGRAAGVKGRLDQVADTQVPATAQTSVPAHAPIAARAAGGAMPAQLVSLLQRMRAEIEQRCDYVGPSFAEEARRIHNGESEARGIYGEATDGDAEALREDGIEVARIPWVPRAD